MGKHCSLAETAQLLLQHKNMVLTTHVSPDGDALGSSLALAKALNYLGKTVRVVVDDDLPKNLSFLPGVETIERFGEGDEVTEIDLLVVLDASSEDRIGNVGSFVKCKALLNIDHHISNTEYADYLYLDANAAATGEIICELAEELGYVPDKDAATCMYTAMYTDCGSFQYSNTTPKTMCFAAKLLEYGVKPNEISDALSVNTKENLALLTKVLQTLSFAYDGKVAYLEISNELYDKKINTDNFISYPRYLEGVEVAVLFKAVEPTVTRVSMRSKNADVAETALSFGGGGHLRAAGCTINLPLAEAKEALLKALKEKI